MFLLFLLTFFLFLPFFSSSPSLPSFSLFSPQVAFRSPENLLVCAPTGAGKTNVACLTMLRDVGLHLKENEMNSDDSSTPSVDLSAFKIVYVAPMKALVKEVVESFNKRLGYIPGFQVRELSGDVSMSRKEVMETTLVVTTPEKWYVTPFALTFFFIFFFLTFCCISPSLFSLSLLSLFSLSFSLLLLSSLSLLSLSSFIPSPPTSGLPRSGILSPERVTACMVPSSLCLLLTRFICCMTIVVQFLKPSLPARYEKWKELVRNF